MVYDKNRNRMIFVAESIEGEYNEEKMGISFLSEIWNLELIDLTMMEGQSGIVRKVKRRGDVGGFSFSFSHISESVNHSGFG